MIVQDSKVSYYVYILLCENDSFYTGYTTDIKRRYKEHIKGTTKSKYTRSFKVKSLAQCWQILGSKSTAMKAENYIKKLSKKEKENLILNPGELSNVFLCKLCDKITMHLTDN